MPNREDEVAFYDALADNESAREVMQDDTLRLIARELTDRIKSKASLEVYDLLGRRIAKIIDGELDAGQYTIIWDGKDSNGDAVSSGIYFYRLTTEFGVKQAKMTLLK